MTICHTTFGRYHGLYIKSYNISKINLGDAGNIGFGKSSHQCHLELHNTNGKSIRISYGDTVVCSGIKSEGTIILQKTKIKH